MWYVILHMTFVVSALLLGVLDKMSFAKHRDTRRLRMRKQRVSSGRWAPRSVVVSGAMRRQA